MYCIVQYIKFTRNLCRFAPVELLWKALPSKQRVRAGHRGVPIPISSLASEHLDVDYRVARPLRRVLLDQRGARAVWRGSRQVCANSKKLPGDRRPPPPARRALLRSPRSIRIRLRGCGPDRHRFQTCLHRHPLLRYHSPVIILVLYLLHSLLIYCTLYVSTSMY